jgi:hypothetical protein
MRKLLLAVCLAGLAGCADRLVGPEAQQAARAYGSQASSAPILAFLNGVEIDPASLKTLEASLIDSVHVLKGPRFKRAYPERAIDKQGAIFVYTRRAK